MESQGLVESRGSELHLTAEGERWAMHIVRAHRLWERYLADEARMPLEKVHTEAHRREHGLTAEQLDEMEAALGHPSRDPHGDPIPTREGIMPKDEINADYRAGRLIVPRELYISKTNQPSRISKSQPPVCVSDKPSASWKARRSVTS